MITMIGKGPPCDEVEKGEEYVQKVSMAMKDRLARTHSGEEELL